MKEYNELMSSFVRKMQSKGEKGIVLDGPMDASKWKDQNLKILFYFKEIYGSPESKPNIISKILKDNALNLNEIVFVGDATSDSSAAQENGVNFIARLNSENSDLMNEQRWKIKDLKFLDVVLNDIEQDR